METRAPAGYNLLTEPLKVSIDMTGHNTWTKLSDGSASQEKPNPYELCSWLQEATIRVTDLNDHDYDASRTTVYSSVNDVSEASVRYSIANSAGYELPSTGGTGSRMMTVIGVLLIMGVGALLRRGRKTNP